MVQRNKLLKVVVFVPLESEKVVREAIVNVGGGKVENYSGWTFCSYGITRVKALPGANPARGNVGKMEKIKEVRIETTCYELELKQLVAAIKKVHPYERVPIDVIEIREC